MRLVKGALRLYVGVKGAGGEIRHDLAQDRDVILGLAAMTVALDAEPRKVGAQPRERPLMQEAGEVIGAVGQKLAASHADEEIEYSRFTAVSSA